MFSCKGFQGLGCLRVRVFKGEGVLGIAGFRARVFKCKGFQGLGCLRVRVLRVRVY